MEHAGNDGVASAAAVQSTRPSSDIEAGASNGALIPSEQSSSAPQHEKHPQHYLEESPSIISVSSWILGNSSSPTSSRDHPASNILLTSANHTVIHSHPSPSKWPNVFQLQQQHNESHRHHSQGEPPFGYLRCLLGSLLLTTTLACCSALDARYQCTSKAAYDLYNLWDDDANVNDFEVQQRLAQEAQACLQMFRFVMIPVGCVTAVLGLVSLYLIRPSVVSSSDSSNPLEQDQESTASNSTASTTHHRHVQLYHVLLRLLWTVPLILLSWTYGIVVIMLQPRNDSYYHISDNPYHSLAAVDSFGHVGDNANLYYTTWISFGLCIVLVYQIGTDLSRQSRGVEQSRPLTHPSDGVEALFWNPKQWHSYHQSRATWYHSFYRLRIRSGLWVAACLSCFVVLATSVHLWWDVLAPTARRVSGGQDKISFSHVCAVLAEHSSYYNNRLPSGLCARTYLSMGAGAVAALLCVGAIAMHLRVRRAAASVVHVVESAYAAPPAALSVQHYTEHLFFQQQQQQQHDHHYHGDHKLPLRLEFGVSICLCLLLGLNAVFATGVQGPASTVGNLYYSSWIAFLLCLRVCLGCLEELYDIKQEEHAEEQGTEMTLRQHQSGKYIAPTLSSDESMTNDVATTTTMSINSPTNSSHSSSQLQRQESMMSPDLLENQRAQRLRRLLFLAIFSCICVASALDAAFNQGGGLTRDQQYLILAPAIVAVLSMIQVGLCLRTYTYMITIANIWMGLLLSAIAFGLWLADLIITMHSEHSWAVNQVGDIQMANLYYFSWASIITAGFHFSSYLVLVLGLKKKDYLTVAWLSIVKVCFVILGAGAHIWYSIQGTCTFEDVQSGAVTFCSRTVFAIVVSLTGMLVGCLVVGTRIFIQLCCPAFSMRIRAHVEMIVSIFLVLLFGVAVALITGIGGPGQSVGDLYYATWVAFLITIVVGLTCYIEIVRQDNEASLEHGEKQYDTAEEGSEYSHPHYVRTID